MSHHRKEHWSNHGPIMGARFAFFKGFTTKKFHVISM